MLGDPERFVFHRAAELEALAAAHLVTEARAQAEARATEALARITAGREICGCAVVAKPGVMPALADIVASHPRIHTAEACLYRDALLAAARACGLSASIVAPGDLDVKAPGVAEAGRVVGRPWGRDEKIAALAAFRLLGR